MTGHYRVNGVMTIVNGNKSLKVNKKIINAVKVGQMKLMVGDTDVTDYVKKKM